MMIHIENMTAKVVRKFRDELLDRKNHHHSLIFGKEEGNIFYGVPYLTDAWLNKVKFN